MWTERRRNRRRGELRFGKAYLRRVELSGRRMLEEDQARLQ